MGKILPPTYYQSEDVLFLAKDLLGKILFTRIEGETCSGIIVETEAYRAPDDRACHAYNNLRTKRTEVMFAEGGRAYIYLCYGIHHLMNIVTGPRDTAHAVLIRALEPVSGIKIMAARRNLETNNIRLTNGPGALSSAMGLRQDMTGTSLLKKTSGVWLEDNGIRYAAADICNGPRIGIHGSREAVNYPWRFFVKNNKYVSATKNCP